MTELADLMGVTPEERKTFTQLKRQNTQGNGDFINNNRSTLKALVMG